MSVLAWFLWTLAPGALGGPVHWTDSSEPPPFHLLPVFVPARGPLVDPELLRPNPYRRRVHAELTALLLPDPQPPPRVHVSGSRAVEVWCGADAISVRLDRVSLAVWSDPDRFRLGSCGAKEVSARFVYFHSGLGECGGELQVDGGHLVYTVPLLYAPPPQGLVIRVPPLHLPVHCWYHRFHYAYKVGFRPQVQHAAFWKSLGRKASFSLTVHDQRWEPLPKDQEVFLGGQLYFLAQTGPLQDGQRLYVDSCYASSSPNPLSTPRVDIVANYGCMWDSRRDGSRSRFLQRTVNMLSFSVDVFLFRTVSQVQYLHCSVSLGWTASPTSKSCNYNQPTGRWEELEEQAPPPSVCSCCDSTCGDQPPEVTTVSSPGWLVADEEEANPRTGMDPVLAEDRWEELNLTRNQEPSFQWKTGSRHEDDVRPEDAEWRPSVRQQQNQDEDPLQYQGAQTRDPPETGSEGHGSELGLPAPRSTYTTARPATDRVTIDAEALEMRTAEDQVHQDHNQGPLVTTGPPSVSETPSGLQSASGSAGLDSVSWSEQVKRENQSEDIWCNNAGPLWSRDRMCGNGSDPHLGPSTGPVTAPHNFLTEVPVHRRTANGTTRLGT
ncbi:unnamed protein product [Ophioblennius macclurei]